MSLPPFGRHHGCYRATENAHSIYNAAAMASGGSYRQAVRLTRVGSRDRISLVSKGRFTVNANGELVVDRESVRVHCAL